LLDGRTLTCIVRNQKDCETVANILAGTLPMTHLGLSKDDTVEKRDDGKFYLTRNGKEFFPEQMTIDRSSGTCKRTRIPG
jgi:hypothetical protein